MGIFDQLGRYVEPFDAVLHDGGSQTKAEMKLINPAILVACSAILAAQKSGYIALPSELSYVITNLVVLEYPTCRRIYRILDDL